MKAPKLVAKTATLAVRRTAKATVRDGYAPIRACVPCRPFSHGDCTRSKLQFIRCSTVRLPTSRKPAGGDLGGTMQKEQKSNKIKSYGRIADPNLARPGSATG